MEPRVPDSIRRVIVAASVVLLAMTLTPTTIGAQMADDFFAGETVDDVWIHINGRDWQTLRARYQDNTFYPCDVQWRTVRLYNAGCRSRGFGSRSPIKPGFDIHFAHYVSGQRFLGLSELVLDNLYQDPSMLQERLTMWLFRRAGVVASREAHVKLFVGSGREFVGLYTVVEAVSPALLARGFGEPDAYLYEYRWLDVYNFQELGDALEPYAARFAARTHEYESIYALYAPIRQLITTINEAPLDRIGEVLDLQSFAAQLAVENYVSDWDGLLGYAGVNNFYLSRMPDRPARLIPWDKDFGFIDVNLPPWHNVEFNVLAAKVWNDPILVRLYLRGLLMLANDGATIEQEFERELAQIEPYAVADRLKPQTDEEFALAVTRIRDFLRQRPGIIRAYVRALAPDLVGVD